jgi:mevalonate kinase
LKKTFYSNGKLLITAEYTVLDGATALALPTKFGQSLEVATNAGNMIQWTSLDADGAIWLEVAVRVSDVLQNNQQSTSAEANTLIKILHKAHTANPQMLTSGGFEVVTKLTFPRNWGLGTSSTLINNIARWFGIDAYDLLAKTFGGSGYDIACAQNDSPLLYTLQQGRAAVTPVAFNPAFAENVWFVYLNQKQNSRDAIAAYRERRAELATIINRIDSLTQDALTAQNIRDFASALEKHEALMAGVLGIAPVQERLFPEFKGVVKSLGAWGGDFVMAIAEENPVGYFKKKGYEVVLPWGEMIL